MTAYGKAFQIKVISSLLTHKKFLINIYDVLIEDYFDSDASKWVIKQITSYYDKYHTTPTMDVLKVELNKLENESSLSCDLYSNDTDSLFEDISE